MTEQETKIKAMEIQITVLLSISEEQGEKIEEQREQMGVMLDTIDRQDDALSQCLEVMIAPADLSLTEEFNDAKHNAQSVRRGGGSDDSHRDVVPLHRLDLEDYYGVEG